MTSDYHGKISKSFDELVTLINTFSNEQKSIIEQIALIVIKTLQSNHCIFWCGNGGSAAESQHLAAELVGRFKKNRFPYKSISLNSDTAVLTCISNDFGYEEIFSRQIDGLGKKGDLLIALSTSGNSKNIERAIYQAKNKGIYTISLLGKGGGKIKDLADNNLIINSNDTARIQEAHLLVGHIICELVEEKFS